MPDEPQTNPADATVPDADATQVLPAVPRAPSTMPAAVAPAGGPPPAPPAAPPRRSGPARFAIWLAVILAVLLLVTVIAALLTRGGADPAVSTTPSASVTPSVTPSVSVTPSPSVTPTPSPTETTPPPSGPQFASFSTPDQAPCPDEASTVEITVSWESTGATSAWVGIATDNAKEEPYSEVETSGSALLPFPCSNESQVYTVTLEDADGALASESGTVTRSTS